tara:strand:+ start:13366 stop:14514 length:1149 start_codon:yes stop_codon:yes gene_type:complete
MFFSMGAFQMQAIVQSFYVYKTTSSALILGLVTSGWAAPILIFSLFGGSLSDKINRKRIIVLGESILFIFAILIGLSIEFSIDHWSLFLFNSMMQGAMFSFMGPSRQSLIPQVVGNKLITNALALNSAAMTSTTFIAPGIGGVLYSLINPEGAFYVIAILRFLSFFLTQLISPINSKIFNTTSDSVVKGILEGLKYLLNNRIILLLILSTMIAVLASYPFQLLLPILVVDVYKLESEAYGFLISLIGLGSLMGSIFIAFIGKWKRGLLLVLGIFVSANALLLIGLIPDYSIAAILMIFLGLGSTAPMTINMALIMDNTEDMFRGRMMSIIMMQWGLMPIGVLPFSWLIEKFGGQFAVLTMSLILFIVAVYIFFFNLKVRNLD